MGQQHSRIRQDHEGPLFVIPPYIGLSQVQTTILLTNGQQRGVPFCIGEQGIFRPPAHCVKFKCSQSHATLIPDSFKINLFDHDRYSLSFTYNSSQETRTSLIIYVRTSKSTTKLENWKVQFNWGPITLPSGSNMHWSSDSTNQFISQSQLSSLCGDSNAEIYNIVISLVSSSSNDSMKKSKLIIPNNNKLMFMSLGKGGQSQNSNHSIHMPQLESTSATSSYKPVNNNSSSSSFFTSSIRNITSPHRNINDLDNGHTKRYIRLKHRSMGVVNINPREEDSELQSRVSTGNNIEITHMYPDKNHKTQQNPNAAVTSIQSAMNLLSSPISGEFSYFKVSKRNSNSSEQTPKFNSSSPKIERNFDVKLTSQRIALPEGIFIVKDIFGLDGVTAAITPSNSSSIDKGGGGGTDVAVSSSSAEKKGENNSYSDEHKTNEKTDNLKIYEHSEDNTNNNAAISSFVKIQENQQAEKIIENPGNGEGVKSVATPQPGDPGEDFSSGNTECVICLSDAKTVIVFPCRHLCMCNSCAEILPAQGNKCPICRQLASLLIRMPTLKKGQPISIGDYENKL